MPALSKALNEKVAASKVLVVGAGGIGCELLKNLVLTGFRDIEVVDLDTIEVSNLNRQFLFQKEHVGKSKAAIATESALSFCPAANIIYHHTSIMGPQFDVSFFKKFLLVLSALDNRAARSHVNRLCLAADVVLIESGSKGYLGQVSVIKKGVTECYDCVPKPVRQFYPGCTIRNTPSEPVHCVIWAKHLFNQLFGEADSEEDVSPDIANIDGGNKNYNSSNGGPCVQYVSTRKWAIGNNYDPKILFNKLFNDDIVKLRSMSNLWKDRSPPITLSYDILPNEHEDSSNVTSGLNTQGRDARIKDQVVWTPMNCWDEFNRCVEIFRDRLSGKNLDCILVWDKDDETVMHFVTACANLRAYVFGIPLKSLFDIKSMASNIIPAIATTNACVAGLIVMEALKIVKGRLNDCRSVFIKRQPNSYSKILVNQILDSPNPQCYSCSEKPQVFIKLNVNTFTIKQLKERILKQELNMIAPDVAIADGSCAIIISNEEKETAALQNKVLSELNVVDGTCLQCDDYMQSFELRLNVIHCQDFENDVNFIITTDTDKIKPEETINKPKGQEEIV